MKYLFILGQASDLAKQEIVSLLSPEDEVIISGDNFIILETKEKVEKLISNLAGTVKIARYLESIKDLKQLTSEDWQSWLKIEEDKKVNFGFSLYHDSSNNHRYLQQLALQVKKGLKAEGHKARLVSSKEAILSSVIVNKNNLLNNELLVIKAKDGWVLGLTEAVQDYAGYGYRDMGRPQRDDQSGMLPPKLAQMMINLAGPERNKTLLDPFCGSGTILQEASLLNFTKIYGTDKNAIAIKDSLANINWLRSKFNIASEIVIKKANVNNLAQTFPPTSIDLIVAEPYMGPARFIQKHHQLKDFVQIVDELQLLYLSAFQQFTKIIKPGGQIIFIFPIFNLDEQKIYTLEENKIIKLGFKPIKPSIQSNNLTPTGNIIYSRPNQKVQREITHWTI